MFFIWTKKKFCIFKYLEIVVCIWFLFFQFHLCYWFLWSDWFNWEIKIHRQRDSFIGPKQYKEEFKGIYVSGDEGRCSSWIVRRGLGVRNTKGRAAEATNPVALENRCTGVTSRKSIEYCTQILGMSQREHQMPLSESTGSC